MKYLVITLSVLLSAYTLKAQDNVSVFLNHIEQNNTTLKALRKQTEANKIENHTGINMENPEVEFGYLWGDSKAEGNKYDIAVKQSFDFPTAYRYKRQIANQMDKEIDYEYDSQRREILLEARTIYVETVYRSENRKTLTERLEAARQLFEAYQRRLDNGDVDIIEYNKTKLNLINIEKSYQLNEVELDNFLKEIQRINGGMTYHIENFRYSDHTLPLNFDEWFHQVKTNNPALRLTAQQIETSHKQVQLARALNLPKFSAGYSNGYEAGARFNGFTVGISVPLWENKNKVKAQRARTFALETEYNDNTLQFYNTLNSQYNRANKLKVILSEYEQVLSYSNDYELLKKSLDMGQMSVITFLQELTVYYETIDLYMETRRDLGLALAQLEQWAD